MKMCTFDRCHIFRNSCPKLTANFFFTSEGVSSCIDLSASMPPHPPSSPSRQLREASRPDPNFLPPPSSKRPRGEEDEASTPKAKTKRQRGPHLSKIVPSIESGHTLSKLASARVTTKEDCSAPESRSKVCTTARPVSSYQVKLRDNSAARDAQTSSQVPIATSSRIATSKCSNASTAHTHDDSAVEAYGPTSTANDKPLEPSVALQDAQTSIATTHLAPSTLSHEVALWKYSPFTLVNLGEKLCPRLAVSSDHGLYRLFGAGQHPLAAAVAKIHQFGSIHGSVPCEARQVLKVFNEIHLGHHSSPHITLLDPLLYPISHIHSLDQLETFRRKEWGWLVVAGTTITGANILQGVWHLDSVQADYNRLQVALVISRDDHTIIHLPGPSADKPPQVDVIQVRSHLYKCSKIANLSLSFIQTPVGPYFRLYPKQPFKILPSATIGCRYLTRRIFVPSSSINTASQLSHHTI